MYGLIDFWFRINILSYRVHARMSVSISLKTWTEGRERLCADRKVQVLMEICQRCINNNTLPSARRIRKFNYTSFTVQSMQRCLERNYTVSTVAADKCHFSAD